MRLENKTALITGSSQGIGEEIAYRFAAEGADIVINYVGAPAAPDAIEAKVKALGRRVVGIEADVSNIDEVQAMVAKGVAELGRIDILVNNAGVERRAPMWEVSEKEWDFVIDVNLKGAFFCAQAVARHLIDTKRPGKIINISSVHEELPFPHFTAYCASKGGVKMMTRNLMVELAPYGITINNIAPGAIVTPINRSLLDNPDELKALLANIPLKRLGTTDDVAEAAVFLASKAADYITGTTITVDGGLTWFYEEQ